MKLIDVDDLSFDISGLAFIYPDDYRGLAEYFGRQVQGKPEVEAIPCGYIRAKAYKATGPESVYLRKLLDDWEKENEA